VRAELGPVSFTAGVNGYNESIVVQQQSNRTAKKKNPSCTTNT
jgi:hypothetical protein